MLVELCSGRALDPVVQPCRAGPYGILSGDLDGGGGLTSEGRKVWKGCFVLILVFQPSGEPRIQ